MYICIYTLIHCHISLADHVQIENLPSMLSIRTRRHAWYKVGNSVQATKPNVSYRICISVKLHATIQVAKSDPCGS